MDKAHGPAAKRHNRREFLLRVLATGSITPFIAGLLAACDQMDDDDSGQEPTAPSESPSATATLTATPSPTSRDLRPTSTPAAATARPTSTPFPPDPSRHFQITTWMPVIAMNPHIGWRKTSWVASRLTLEPLFEFDADLNPVLLLAAEWPTVENGLLDPEGHWVTWKLRRGVRWHDGEPFDADDVIATWHFATNVEGAPRTTTHQFELVTDIERVDGHTVRIHFSRPNPQWRDLFRGAEGSILPGHVFESLTGAYTDYQDEVNLVLPGTGPWRVTSFDHSSRRARFERFEGYWDANPSNFDTVELQFLSGDAVSNAHQVFTTGNADYTFGLEVVETDRLLQFESDSSTARLLRLQGLSIETLFLNFANPRAEPEEHRSEPDSSHPILSDLRVRQAINLAVPRDRLVELYGNHITEPAVHPIAEPEIYQGHGLPAGPDLAQAQALLDEAGFEGGTLLIQTTNNAVREQAQEIIADALEELGFTVELDAIDAGVFFSRDADSPNAYGHFYADMQIYTPGAGISPYPLEWAEHFRSDRIASAANGWSEPNISRYANPEFDRLHDEARTEMNPERQAGLWRQMMNILTDDVVVIPLLQRNSLAAVTNRVEPAGFSPWAVEPSWNLHHWTVRE